MKFFVRRFAVLLLTTLVAPTTFFGMARGQAGSGTAAPNKPTIKQRVQNYTRIHPKTGQSVAVRSYKRRAPTPKPVEVRPYIRSGKPVQGHVRQKPASNPPPKNH